ncbi:MAG TPA: sodium/solute symporter [Sedimentisphaerales bacterium]|nr:sodium/solute symporter [Sedimentisphaerales bacterium]
MVLAKMTISGLDLGVIIAYLLGIMIIGIWVGFRRHASSQQYFLAGKSLGWFSIGAALFASNISTIHLVGLAAAGADVGMVMGNFEWMASFCLIILGLVFAPFYFKSRISTLPEFLEKRYSPQARTFLAFVAITGALLIHIGISLFAGAKLFQSFLGIDVMWSILIISAVTVIYTALGGLKAVVVTETIQTFLLLGGAILVTVLGIQYLPNCGIESVADFRAAIKPNQMSMVHSLTNAKGNLNEYSWLAVLLGYPVLGIWYWCSDQTIVQRVLGSRSQRDSQNGALFAGFLKILPVFLMVFPGVIGYLMYTRGSINIPLKDDAREKAIAYLVSDAAISRVEEPDGELLLKMEGEELALEQQDSKWVIKKGVENVLPPAFKKVAVDSLIKQGRYAREDEMLDFNLTLPGMINRLVPLGVKGLLAAGLLAALMSTIAAALNSCATLISVDVIKRMKPDIKDETQVTIGRFSAAVVMVLAMLWSTQGDQFGTIFEAINKIPMIFAPAVTTVFLLGVFWRRGTNKAALTTFAVGCAVGLVYFVMDMPVIGSALLAGPREGFAGLVTDPVQGLGLPFMIVGPILCAMCIVIYVVVSLNTPAPDPAKLENVCWEHPLQAIRQGAVKSAGDPRIVALVLFLVMVVLYYLFRK